MPMHSSEIPGVDVGKKWFLDPCPSPEVNFHPTIIHNPPCTIYFPTNILKFGTADMVKTKTLQEGDCFGFVGLFCRLPKSEVSATLSCLQAGLVTRFLQYLSRVFRRVFVCF